MELFTGLDQSVVRYNYYWFILNGLGCGGGVCLWEMEIRRLAFWCAKFKAEFESIHLYNSSTWEVKDQKFKAILDYIQGSRPAQTIWDLSQKRWCVKFSCCTKKIQKVQTAIRFMNLEFYGRGQRPDIKSSKLFISKWYLKPRDQQRFKEQGKRMTSKEKKRSKVWVLGPNIYVIGDNLKWRKLKLTASWNKKKTMVWKSCDKALKKD